MTRLSTILACLACAAAMGQEADPNLETVVVTASRTPLALRQTGSTVSVLTRQDIERRQAVSLADVLRDVPGLAVSQSGSFGAQTQIRIRGAEANHALVLIDGVEANDPAASDEFQFEHLLTDDIQRVEIVRGPQSALWGSDALSGVINIITKSRTEGLQLDGNVETGSCDTVHAAGRAAFGDERFGLNIGAAHLDTAGTNISRSGPERDGYRNDTFNLTAHAAPGETTRLEVFARQTDATKQLDAVDLLTGLPTDADRSTDSTQRYLRTGLFVGRRGGSGHDFKLTYLDTHTASFADGADDGSFAAEKLGFYYQGTLPLPGPLSETLTLAVNHERSRFRQRGRATPFGDPNQTQQLATTGFVAEYLVSAGRAVNLSVSVRYDDSDAFRSATTYRLSASYLRSSSKTHIRGGIGTGQRAPTFVERFGYFADVFLGNPQLEPESSSGWEVGIDQSLLAGHLSVSATLFAQDLDDEIASFVFDSSVGQFTAMNRTGKSYRHGLELALSAAPTRALSMTASYTLTDSTEPDAAGGQQPEIRRPRHTASFDLNYAVSRKANLNLNVAYTGARYDTFFAPYPQPPVRQPLGSYRLVGLAASYRFTPRVQFIARIDNLLDEDYEDVIGFATPGRAVYAGVRVGR